MPATATSPATATATATLPTTATATATLPATATATSLPVGGDEVDPAVAGDTGQLRDIDVFGLLVEREVRGDLGVPHGVLRGLLEAHEHLTDR